MIIDILKNKNDTNIFKIFLKILSYFFILYISIYFFYFIVVDKNYWFHPEGINVFNYHKNTSLSFDKIFKIIFDGHSIDSNDARFRPLSHLVELVNNKLRSNLSLLFGPNVFLNTFSTLIMFPLISFILYSLFKNLVKDNLLAFSITILIISSTAFLSGFIFMFRPAKSLMVFFGIILIMLFITFFKRSTKKNLIFSYISISCLLITDEEGYFLAGIFLMLFAYQIIINQEFLKKIKIVVTWIFLNLLNFILIFLYVMFQSKPKFHGKIHDEPIISNFINLSFDRFLSNTIIISEHIFNGSFGLINTRIHTVLIFLFVLFNFIYFLYKKKLFLSQKSDEKYFLILSFVILIFYILYPIFTSMLEQIGGNIFMRSVGFYYNSSVIIVQIFVVIFLIFCLRYHFKVLKLTVLKRSILIILLSILSYSNLQNFKIVNNVFELIHYRPKSSIEINLILENRWFMRNNCNLFNKNSKFELSNTNRNEELEILASKIFVGRITKRINGMKKIDPLNQKNIVTPSWIKKTIKLFSYCSPLNF